MDARRQSQRQFRAGDPRRTSFGRTTGLDVLVPRPGRTDPYDSGMAHSEEMVAARLAARNAAIADTRVALRSWSDRPSQLLPWVAISAIIAAILLLATYIVAVTATPEQTSGSLIAADPSAHWADFGFILGRNFTVLLLHLMVCFATYLVRRSLPIQAGEMRGFQAWIHRNASTPALLLVVALTIYSILQQALVLGHSLADLSAHGDMTAAGILVRLLPHAVPELIAVFLPLAAALWLESRDRNKELLAAVAACVVIAVPVVIASAFVEVVIASDFF